MSGERATYLDSSAIVKLVVSEAESVALRRYLRRRRPLASSTLALSEVGRALMPLGIEAVRRGSDVLARIDLIRVTELLLTAAAALRRRSCTPSTRSTSPPLVTWALTWPGS